MRPKKAKPDPQRRAKLLADVQRAREKRDQGYREQALRLFPNVCGRCGREFAGANLRELTVHHKDSNHLNNPPDGSNWELLCLYCHDDEHQDPEQRAPRDGSIAGGRSDSGLGFQAFEGLKHLLPPEGDAEGGSSIAE